MSRDSNDAAAEEAASTNSLDASTSAVLTWRQRRRNASRRALLDGLAPRKLGSITRHYPAACRELDRVHEGLLRTSMVLSDAIAGDAVVAMFVCTHRYSFFCAAARAAFQASCAALREPVRQ